MSLRDAAGAVRRGAHQEALVVLWNEVEPARLAGDRGTLRQIEGLARRIEAEGDEGERREAERLVEAITDAAAADASSAVSTAVGEGRVGESFEREPAATSPEGEPSSGIQLGPLVWLLVVLGIVVLNLLGQVRE